MQGFRETPIDGYLGETPEAEVVGSDCDYQDLSSSVSKT